MNLGFVKWLLALVVAAMRAARPRAGLAADPSAVAPRRCDGVAGLACATCSSCRAELGSVWWRYQDATYCRACHELVSSDSDSSSAFSD